MGDYIDGRISSYLEDDHARIETALRRATSSGDHIQPEAYVQFRGALLRHIAMEEKILFPAIRNAQSGNAMLGIDQLHLDHGALAALLVPTPTKSILDAIRTILQGHNRIEEGPEGIYRQFEGLHDIDKDSILARLQATPPVALNPHVDNAIAVESMRAAVRRAGYSFDI